MDHKGILYRIRGNPGSEKVSTVKALPHRAFDLLEVVKFASDRLAEFNDKTLYNMIQYDIL